MSGKAGGKPELDPIKVMNGAKVELGAKVEWPVEISAYLKRDFEGKVNGAALTAKLVE